MNQLDKIRSAYGVAEWSEPFFNNRALFSDYYLNERLPQLQEWQADAAPAFRALSRLLADAQEKFAGKREAELRTLLYQPLFAALGWKAEAQKGGHEDDARADYVLSDASGSRVPCLTYVWDRYLNGPDETRDSETPRENPAQTVVGLLEHGQAGGWAIVTNGKVWRLYSARAHSRATNYYEIDLEETLASPDVDVAFRYFWLFFRPSPPTPLPSGERGVGFLDFLLDESASFAKALGERLKDRVFGEVFPYFAEGFIKHGHERPSTAASPRSVSAQDAWTDDDLVVAFQATLTFLYRLLFVLYAEARDLLPVRETRGYWEVSLQRIKEEIAGKAVTLEDEVAARLEKAYSASETTLYDRLLKLFRVIDRGAAELNVPIYNGGLFQTVGQDGILSNEAARFLQSHKIPDRYLALGLDRMARDIDARRGDLVAIDYKSLGVRHLGSIYEGLLEFRLRIAREKMAVVRGKKTDEVIPARDVLAQDAKIKATLPKGAAYLENDKHERKATGSYYTPDYIVKYIVQHTVGPVLDEKFEALRPRLRQAAKRFNDTVTRKQTIEHAAPDRPALLNDLAGDLLRDLFDVKVLDPAMGSGHFLVEAVDFITDRLLRFLYGFPFVNHFFEGQRRLILSALERQGVTVDPARLTDVNLLKRHVLKRCIFGVDLNPMAVELAKVSVWLDCFTLGAPLSFLDHHLKWGNSLIGTTAREADYELRGGKSQQMTFLTGPFVGLLRSAEIMRGISTLGDATVEQVHESASLFKQFEDAAKPYKQLLDVFVSRNLGIKHAGEFLQLYGAEVMTADPSKLGKDHRKVLVERTRLFEKHRFFHWDLEFPEVFIDLEKADWQVNAGFDAVIGNPPYANAWLMTADDSETRLAIDTTVNTAGLLEGHWDLFAAFIVRALQVARHGGWHSFIVPDALLREKYALALRKHLLTDLSIERVMHFEGTNVFDEVSRHCVVYAITTTASEVARQTMVEASVSETSLSTVIVGHVPQNEWLQAEGAQIRVELAAPIKRQISRKVFASSLRVGQFCYVMVGATTHSKDGVSFKKADIISWEPIGNAQRLL